MVWEAEGNRVRLFDGARGVRVSAGAQGGAERELLRVVAATELAALFFCQLENIPANSLALLERELSPLLPLLEGLFAPGHDFLSDLIAELLAIGEALGHALLNAGLNALCHFERLSQLLLGHETGSVFHHQVPQLGIGVGLAMPLQIKFLQSLDQRRIRAAQIWMVFPDYSPALLDVFRIAPERFVRRAGS